MADFNLTPRELEILIAYVRECTGTVDWHKVAESSNCKTAKYARDRFASIRTKLLNAGGGAGGDADNAAANGDGEGITTNGKGKKKATPRKRKRKNGSDGDDEETPKGKKRKKAATPKNDEADAVVKDEPNEAGELMDQLN